MELFHFYRCFWAVFRFGHNFENDSCISESLCNLFDIALDRDHGTDVLIWKIEIIYTFVAVWYLDFLHFYRDVSSKGDRSSVEFLHRETLTCGS